MDANVSPGDDLSQVPLAVRLFRIEGRSDSFPGLHGVNRIARLPDDTLFARAFAAVWNGRFLLKNNIPSFDIAISPCHAPPLADAFLHDIAFKRPHPRLAPGAIRSNAPIEQAGVAVVLRLGSRRPLLLSPFVANPYLRISKLRVRCDGSVKFARDMDGPSIINVCDGENSTGIVVQPEWLFGSRQWAN